MAAAAALSSERLEVSIDGLTLSPDSEETRPGQADVRPLPLAGSRGGTSGQPGGQVRDEAGGDGDDGDGALNLERRWGFGLEELYGLALRFFKGDPAFASCQVGKVTKVSRPSVDFPAFPS